MTFEEWWATSDLQDIYHGKLAARKAWEAAMAARPEARQAFGVALNKHDEPLRELCFNYRNCATEDAEETFQRIVRFVTAYPPQSRQVKEG